MRDAGGVILGKASMGEFAGGSYNIVGGEAINPYNFKRQTGGSSSGSEARSLQAESKLLGFASAYEQATKMRHLSPLLPPLQGETTEY